jgi:protocatechuate 3,4-dioxygenase beta subunit
LLLASPLVFLLPSAHATSPLAATPAQMLGPFYPLRPDPAAGNDLSTIDGKARARGRALAIVGRVTDTAGRPQSGVLLEIGQTNAHGRYTIRRTTARRRRTRTSAATAAPPPARMASTALPPSNPWPIRAAHRTCISALVAARANCW